MSHDEQILEADDYAHHEIQEYHNTPVPLLLKLTYVILPIWGVMVWFFFWDGSSGWGDRGYWHELQAASNTTKKTMIAQPAMERIEKGMALDKDRDDVAAVSLDEL